MPGVQLIRHLCLLRVDAGIVLEICARRHLGSAYARASSTTCQVIDSGPEPWELVSATLTDDATYLDPIMAGTGTQEISDMIGAAQAQFPDHRFELVDGPDVHHDRVRFTWSLGSPAGEPVAVGVDFATTADDGRMRDVTGFLEPAA